MKRMGEPVKEPQANNADSTNVFYGAVPQTKRERKAEKLAKEYFDLESALVILKKARATRHDNAVLEFLMKFTARRAGEVYVKFRKLTGQSPIAVVQEEQ